MYPYIQDIATIHLAADPVVVCDKPELFGFERVSLYGLTPNSKCYIVRRDDSCSETDLRLVIFYGASSASSDHWLFEVVDEQPGSGQRIWLPSTEVLLVKSAERPHMCAVDGHRPIDMGGVRAYCRDCNADLWWHAKTATYSIHDPYESKR